MRSLGIILVLCFGFSAFGADVPTSKTKKPLTVVVKPSPKAVPSVAPSASPSPAPSPVILPSLAPKKRHWYFLFLA